jgi:putative lipoic acid-binding regulatory protein
LLVKPDFHVAFGAAVGTIMQRLGSGASVPIIAVMEIKSDNPEHGFQFPGQFELSAMGSANIGLEHDLPLLLQAAGIQVLKERITWKTSSNGKYVSVKLVFMAESREQLDTAHVALRDHPEVKWTL